MRLALDEARLARDAGDPPVGAVVVKTDGTVVGRGHNRRESSGDATAHAEVLAIREASAQQGHWRLTDCTLVVTLEPCTMCAGAAVLARVDRIVYGTADPKAGAVSTLYRILDDSRLNHRAEVVGGVLAEPCGEILSRFFRAKRAPREV